MTNQEIIKWLWDYGHFRNPSYPESHNVALVDLPKLTLSDNAVKFAVQSIQSLDANYAALGLFKNNRAAVVDGDVGPITRSLLDLPRCACPDYATEEATGQGSWPVPGCNVDDPNRATIHSVRFRVDYSNAPSSVQAMIADVMRMSALTAAEVGLRVDYTDIDGSEWPEDKQELYIAWESIAGSVIGYFNILSRSTCQQRLTGRMDKNYTPSAYMLSILLTHEALGHGVGFEHHTGGIMNPSIMNVPAGAHGAPTWKGDSAEHHAIEWFGGQSTPWPLVMTPPPPTGGIYTRDIDLSGRPFVLQISSKDGLPMDRSRSGKATVDMEAFRHRVRIDPQL